MTRRLHEIQTTFASGELDPLVRQKIDIEDYFRGAAEMTNATPLLQSGFTRRPGMAYQGTLRQTLTAIDLSGAAATAPNGGTAANGIDGDVATQVVTTTGIGVIDPYVVLRVDLGFATVVALVDVVDVFLSTGILNDEFRVQYSTDDAVWNDFGDPVNLDATVRTRRRGLADGVSATARYWRFVRVGSTDMVGATVSLAEMRFFAESGSVGKVREFSVTIRDEDKYIFVMTDQNLDVFQAGIWQASIPVPYVSGELSTVTYTQSLDTILFFHEDHAPYRVFRQGGDDEFDARNQVFKNIPQFNYGDSPGGTDEVQQLKFVSWLAGETFNIFLDTERTSSITYSVTTSTLAASIQTALRSLDNTSAAGITVVANGTDVVTITFGSDDGFTNWPEVRPAGVQTADGVIIPSTITEGEPPGEDVMSATRKWPRTGVFFDQRLWYGGFKSLPDHWGYSVAGDFFDLDNRTTISDRGVLVLASMDQSVVIYHMFAGVDMQIFTSAGEFYIPNAPITPLTTAIKLASRRGISETTVPVETDGATLFVQKGGNTLREFFFSEERGKYVAINISSLAGHLINNPTSVAIQRPQADNEADLFYMANETDELTVLLTSPDQQATSFVRYTTDGKFMALAAEDAGDMYAVVERVINGQTVQYLEKFDTSHYMDAGKIVAVPGGTTVLNDLDYLEGEDIYFIIDGSPAGSATVSGGSVILPKVANAQVILGLIFIPRVKTMPAIIRLKDGTSVGRKKRIVEVEVGLVETTNLELGANNDNVQPVIFKNLGDNLLNVPLFDLAFTGTKRIKGQRGWGYEVQVVLTQSVPGKLTVTSLKMVVAI